LIYLHANSDATEGNILQQIHSLLEKFIENPPPTSPSESSQNIQTEACSVLTIGFLAFYPTSDAQSALLLSLLEGANSISPGKRALLENLLSQLSEWNNVSDVLLLDERKEPDAQKQRYLHLRKVWNEYPDCFIGRIKWILTNQQRRKATRWRLNLSQRGMLGDCFMLWLTLFMMRQYTALIHQHLYWNVLHSFLLHRDYCLLFK
jgi:hypothetical protein